MVKEDTITPVAANPLSIGNDVWIGEDVIITAGCRQIGDGAIIGARSVVTRDVLPFTLVAGVPAKVLRKRFPPEIEAVISSSRWWERPLDYLIDHLECFSEELTPAIIERFEGSFAK
jgi:carbonic anhydrase/acetyltransferase-like protein (isoleucine patch superfamily)